MALHALHGLRVRADVALPAPAWPAADGHDLDVAAGPPDPPRPNAVLLCRIELGDGRAYEGWRDGGGYALRLADEVGFRIAADLRTMTWWTRPDLAAQAPALIAGNALAFLLGLSGAALLHASAVDTADGAIAIAGGQGAGKSTLAGLFCELGAQIVSDDALRVGCDDGGGHCWSGATTLRLRPETRSLGGRLIPAPGVTHDGRLAVPLPGAAGRRALVAILLPQLESRAEPEVERLPAAQAAVALSRFPRWFGWTVPEPVRAQFRTITALAERVPTYRVRLPRADDPSPALAARVADVIAAPDG